MKSLFSLLIVLALATPAFAAARVDNSGFIVWAFLGFCGMIVAAQLIPSLLIMFGMVKGVMSHEVGVEK